MTTLAVFPTIAEIWAAMSAPFMVLLFLTVLDVLTGVIVNLILKKFQWVYLMHFVNTDLMPIFGWIVFLLISMIPPDLTPAGQILPIGAGILYGGTFLAIVASILESLREVGVLSEFLPKVGIGGGQDPCCGNDKQDTRLYNRD